MLSGANAAARSLDHVLVIGETEGDPSVERLLVDEMIERQVDGLLYVTRTTLDLDASALPDAHVVLLNCVDREHARPSILPDERAGGRVAAGALLASGLRDEVYVVGEDPTPNAIAGPLRLAGIVERLGESGLPLRGVVTCEWAVEPAYDAISRWLDAGHRPRGLICLNDRVTMGVYQALGEHGLLVPDDVAVVSFDGSELASWLRPRATSVALPFEQMGDLAVRMLLDSDGVVPGPHLVPMPVVEGDSVVAPRPSSDRMGAPS